MLEALEMILNYGLRARVYRAPLFAGLVSVECVSSVSITRKKHEKHEKNENNSLTLTIKMSHMSG